MFFVSRFEYHMLCFLYPFVTYLLTLPRINMLQCSLCHVHFTTGFLYVDVLQVSLGHGPHAYGLGYGHGLSYGVGYKTVHYAPSYLYYGGLHGYGHGYGHYGYY
jgi:hypothetical protein